MTSDLHIGFSGTLGHYNISFKKNHVQYISLFWKPQTLWLVLILGLSSNLVLPAFSVADVLSARYLPSSTSTLQIWNREHAVGVYLEYLYSSTSPKTYDLPF